MKKLLLVLVLVLSLPVFAQADVDLSGMTFDELVALSEQLNLAIWNSAEWQEVTVPQGLWKVGEDIPEGHWTIKAADGVWCRVSYGSVLDTNGKEVSYSSNDYYSDQVYSTTSRSYEPNENLTQIDIEAKAGSYIEVAYGSVIFSPYSGKQKLGFK